ncbi:MAG: prephenate dehydrogenase/arogenate dehydrogenase family protein [Acidobacteriota bacterium]|nr:prephenate dehydrogenase/arogenate dehydrogenase family protein [Acidobacteriota bacterium]
METVAILGAGLIGGSFALALRKAGYSGRILGVGSPETLDRALALGVIDEPAPLERAAAEADLIYLAWPIRRIVQALPALESWVRPDALVTDAGSTKSAIVRAARALTRCQFLGGHPLAGNERRGVRHADAELFRGRTYVLTPEAPAELETPRAREFQHWLGAIGAVPLVLPAEQHDRVVAYTSHLPQLASTALAAVLEARPDLPLQVSGPALRDSTRLALSSFDIWGDILATNATSIEEALAAYVEALDQVRKDLRSDRISGRFEAGARFARRLRGAG